MRNKKSDLKPCICALSFNVTLFFCFIVIVNGMLYIFGGFNGLTDEHFNDLHCFNPNTCEWKQVIPHGKPPVRRRRQSCIPIGNKVYIFGGTR